MVFVGVGVVVAVLTVGVGVKLEVGELLGVGLVVVRLALGVVGAVVLRLVVLVPEEVALRLVVAVRVVALTVGEEDCGRVDTAALGAVCTVGEAPDWGELAVWLAALAAFLAAALVSCAWARCIPKPALATVPTAKAPPSHRRAWLNARADAFMMTLSPR